MWIKSSGKQWAGSVKGKTGLLQVNVNIDLINTKLCWLSLSYTHTHTPLMSSLWHKFFSGVLFWGGGYFAQRGNYNGIPNPFSPINYSDVTNSLYMGMFSAESSGSCVRAYTCVCVFTSLWLFNSVWSKRTHECVHAHVGCRMYVFKSEHACVELLWIVSLLTFVYQGAAVCVKLCGLFQQWLIMARLISFFCFRPIIHFASLTITLLGSYKHNLVCLQDWQNKNKTKQNKNLHF